MDKIQTFNWLQYALEPRMEKLHFCLSFFFSPQKPEKVPFYINFCVWKRIPPPANSEEPVKVGGSAIGQLKEDKGTYLEV